MWYSGADQAWADVRLARDYQLSPTTPTLASELWNNYVIEEDWDFGFLEVSTDGGTTWAEQKVYTGADVLVRRMTDMAIRTVGCMTTVTRSTA